MKSLGGDALRGHQETLILSALERRPAHGYELLRRLEEAGSGALNLKEGSLYPALYRLEHERLVQASWEENPGRRGPRRRLYRLTPKGRRRLSGRRREWKRFVTVVGGLVEAPA